MSTKKEKIIRSYVGELPIIRHIVEQLGLKEILSKYIKPHGNETFPAVDTIMMLLYNITCERQPLYELNEWIGKIHPGVFGDMPVFCQDLINDDRFGRALDKLYLTDRASLMTDIVMRMVNTTQLDLTQIHNDSTTLKAYGKIPGTTRSGLTLAKGNSKDHRPDLKQLVYTLTISADGAVPIHYKTYSGNRTDDTTHIETWNTLFRIVGQPKFLYVADCKVCTTKQLAHIVGHDGRVVTIIPETWKEVKTFKDELRKKKKVRKIIWRRKVPGDEKRFEYFSSYSGKYFTRKSHYRIHWIFSSEKKIRDKANRELALKKTERDFATLSSKLNTRKLKTRKEIQKALDCVLKQHETRKYYHTSLSSIRETYKVQIGKGRPGPKTEYKAITKSMYTLTWIRKQKVLKSEQGVDGVFPLLATDDKLTAKQSLVAYKYQPRLEKRFTQFKKVHKGAPLLFKSIHRVEPSCFFFFWR